MRMLDAEYITNYEDGTAVIVVYGERPRLEEANVALRVVGFMPYLMVRLPPAWASSAAVEALAGAVEKRLHATLDAQHRAKMARDRGISPADAEAGRLLAYWEAAERESAWRVAQLTRRLSRARSAGGDDAGEEVGGSDDEDERDEGELYDELIELGVDDERLDRDELAEQAAEHVRQTYEVGGATARDTPLHRDWRRGGAPRRLVVAHEIVEGFPMLETPADVRNPRPDRWLKLTLRHPSYVPAVRRLFDGYNGVPAFEERPARAPERDWLPPELAPVDHVKLGECNIDFVLRWIVDSGGTGATPWLYVPLDRATRVPPAARGGAPAAKRGRTAPGAPRRFTRSDLEFIVHTDDVRWMTQNARAPPGWEVPGDGDIHLRTVVFDIEVVNTGGTEFPDPATHPYRGDSCRVTHISAQLFTTHKGAVERVENVTWGYGRHTEDPAARPEDVRVPGEPIMPTDVRGGAFEVRSFLNEADMLCAFRDTFVDEWRPRIAGGHNSNNFDWRWILNRAQALGVGPHVAELGWRLGVRTRMTQKRTASRAKGTHIVFMGNMPGVVMDDTFQAAKQGRLLGVKFASNGLNAVAAHFLGEGVSKMEIDLRQMPIMMGSVEGRRTIARYCAVDACLVAMIMERTSRPASLVEGAGEIGVLPRHMVDRGLQFAVTAQMYQKARAGEGRARFVIPYVPMWERTEESYQGATVIPPTAGYYHKGKVPTLDFASLYPSIMQDGNIGADTGPVPASEVARQALEEGVHYRTVGGHRWLTPMVRRSLMMAILEDMLARRERFKKCMKAARTDAERALWDARQRAAKVVCNTVYGFLGDRSSPVPCLAAAEAVCARGRELIERTKALVEAQFQRAACGCPFDARVIYGDTDSVFVYLDNEEPGLLDEHVWIWGDIMADYVSAHFSRYIRLQNEKFYRVLLLFRKKRYAGSKFEGEIDKKHRATVAEVTRWMVDHEGAPLPPALAARLAEVTATVSDKPKLDAKGLASVRRDTAPVVRNLMDECLRLLVIEGQPALARLAVARVVRELRTGRTPMDQLIMSAQLSKPPDQYKGPSKPAHVQLALRHRKRLREGLVNRDFSVGDRIPYIVVRTEVDSTGPSRQKKPRKGDMVETPEWAMEHNLAPHADWYIEHQLQKPLVQLFAPVLGETSGRVGGVMASPYVQSTLFPGGRPAEGAAATAERETRAALFGGGVMRAVLDTGASAVAARGGAWARFTVAERCLQCRAPVPRPGAGGGGARALCPACRGDAATDRAAAPHLVLRLEGERDTLAAAREAMRDTCGTCSGGNRDAAASCVSNECAVRWRLYQNGHDTQRVCERLARFEF